MPGCRWTLWIAALVVAACGPQTTGGEGSASGTDTSASATETTAATTGDPGPCMLVPEGGPCNAAFLRYYFEPDSGRCAPFTWGGCDGVVPFEDLESCSLTCESCAVQLEPATAMPVAVTITNDTAQTIYLESVQPDPTLGAGYFIRQEYVLLDDASGQPLASHPAGCDYQSLCSALGDAASCFAGCDPGPPHRPGAIRLEPGASFPATAWDGLVRGAGTVAAACVDPECAASGGGDAPCLRLRPLVGNVLSVIARASTMLDGEDCEPSAQGWCQAAPDSFPIDPQLEALGGAGYPTDAITVSFVP